MTLTPLVLTDCRIYLDGADLTGYANKVDASASPEDLDTTTFASSGWKERVAGLFDSTVKIDGLWQAGDLTMPDDVLWGDLGTNTVPLTLVPTTGSVGSTAYVNRIIDSEYRPGADTGKLLSWSATTKGNWPVARGQIMHPQGTARTATGNGTGLQLGAVSASQRLYTCLHVMSIAGTSTPTITVKIQSSVDNTFGSPTDQVTFTAATAVGGQAKSLLGPVTDTWWRAVWTISGTNPSFLFAVSAGIAVK